MEDFYPMPAFVTLQVKDVTISSEWYKTALGFRSVYEAPAPVSLIHLRRARYQDLLLLPARPDVEIVTSPTLVMNFAPDETSLADLTESVKASGARYEGPVERPWNVRELTVYDPDGYVIKFSEPISLDRSFEDIMNEAMQATGQ